VDHNVRLVTDVCHRVVVLDWGKVLTEAGPTEVWEDERVQLAYLGTNARVSGRLTVGDTDAGR
jgi:branched-chain amino acid transport system ATP-binding protein